MKLDYNILWVDDRIKDRPFQKILNETKEFLLNQYFNCNIIEAEDFNEFVEIFSKEKEFDIIITDYSLNEGTFGSQVIDFIRDSQHNFTEIFFYSANDNVKDVKLFSNNRITFFQLTGGDYKELEDEILAVINQTIKKFQNIVAMRGMIMNEVSNLDAQMLEIVQTYTSKTEHQKIIDRVLDELISFYKEKLEKSEKYKKNNNFGKVLSEPILFSSSQRASAIEEIADSIGITNFINEFRINIIKVRNEFAHAVFVKDEKTGREYFIDKKDGVDFNEDKCKDIRRNINIQKGNLDNLQSKIG
jgi:CheY-like chemotaxis protein